MMVERYKYFRFTPRTVRLSITYVFIVPALFGYLGYMTDVRLSKFLSIIQDSNKTDLMLGRGLGRATVGHA